MGQVSCGATQTDQATDSNAPVQLVHELILQVCTCVVLPLTSNETKHPSASIPTASPEKGKEVLGSSSLALKSLNTTIT